MRQEFDLDAAVAAGIIGEDQALSLRTMEADRSGISAASAEYVPLSSGLADIMVALALAAMLAVSFAAVAAFPPAGFLIAGLILFAATRVTIDRRMTAASLVLFGSYCIVMTMTLVGTAWTLFPERYPPMQPVHLARPELTLIVSAATSLACWCYWRLIRLPVAVAAAAIAGLHATMQLVRLALPEMPDASMAGVRLSWGLVLLGLALWWDMTDIRRETARSAVAFWLHAAAGFFLAKASLLLVTGSAGPSGWAGFYVSDPVTISVPGGMLIVGLYILFCAFALVIDRRSLIFAAALHSTIALAVVLDSIGLGRLPVAILVMAAAMLALAFNWRSIRQLLLRLLPAPLVAQLPRIELEHQGRRPTRRHEEMLPRRRAPFRRDEPIG